jgi:hypothetical protein
MVSFYRCKASERPAFTAYMRAVIFVLATGCAMGGAMKQATIVGQCAEGDAACSRRHPQAPIAIGTRFYPDVSASIDGTTTPNLRLESAVPEILAIEDGAFVGKKPGATAVLITTDDGSVVDFVHVWVSPITKITLSRRDGERIGGAVGLAVGEDITLEPALWFGAQRLAGDADVSWTPSDERVISVLRDGSTSRRRLRARAPGKSTITVAIGDAKTTVQLEVVP